MDHGDEKGRWGFAFLVLLVHMEARPTGRNKTCYCWVRASTEFLKALLPGDGMKPNRDVEPLTLLIGI